MAASGAFGGTVYVRGSAAANALFAATERSGPARSFQSRRRGGTLASGRRIGYNTASTAQGSHIAGSAHKLPHTWILLDARLNF
ncbi:MAG: hypothetical protein ABGY75_23280, partial [Gemmataceae bacterium]